MPPSTHPKAIGDTCRLGEAPLWDHLAGRLYWVDCEARRIFRLDPATGGIETFALSGAPGSYGVCRDGRLLMAYRNRLTLLDLAGGGEQVVPTPMVDFAQARFNDGACDRAGRFWLGTMHKDMREPLGALYRVDPDLSMHVMVQGVTVSNGIAFSPDDRVLYHTDTRASVIYAHDFDLAAGTIANRRVFARFENEDERPDGCTTDSDGYVWAAMLGGGRIAVLDPGGREVRSLPVPTSRPTSLCFGGPALDTLYVTSMVYGLSDAQIAAEPDAGRLFAFEGVGQGLKEPRFARG